MNKPRTNSNDCDLDYIDELKTLKKLLDSGALTQEEFDNQKAKVLNNK
ncbi:MAG: SHOCT domain-containing protein [Bacilli bacterium]|nr:SHOCT domain-containing protein [Bacilli bacterium]MBO6284816.1 SHOCT domain-containing protein [Bacilli bacterium]